MENKNLGKLLPVNFEGEQPTVSGRELHEALEIKEKYSDWFKRMCEYGFTENEDFYSNSSKSSFSENSEKPKGGRPSTDHALTIPMAKELCMLQRNDKGKMFRQYFIEIENAWNTPEMVMGRALHIADAKIKMLTATVSDLNQEIEQAKPKVEFYDTVANTKELLSVSQYCKEIYDTDKIQIGRNRMYKWLRDQKYLRYNNEPYQQYVDAGYFVVKQVWVKINGTPEPKPQTFLTGKGQQYILAKLKEFVKPTQVATL